MVWRLSLLLPYLFGSTKLLLSSALYKPPFCCYSEAITIGKSNEFFVIHIFRIQVDVIGKAFFPAPCDTACVDSQ